MYISGAKFEENCLNISREMCSNYFSFLISLTSVLRTVPTFCARLMKDQIKGSLELPHCMNWLINLLFGMFLQGYFWLLATHLGRIIVLRVNWWQNIFLNFEFSRFSIVCIVQISWCKELCIFLIFFLFLNLYTNVQQKRAWHIQPIPTIT